VSRGPTAEEYYAEQLEECRTSFDAGHLPALHDAVELCHLWQIPLPEWAALALLNLIREKYFAPGERDRTQNPKWRYERDFIDFVRWNRMKAFFTDEGVTDEHIAQSLAPANRGRPTGDDRESKNKVRLVSERASASLKGTIAQGEPRQIVESFVRVWDAHLAGDTARYTFTHSVPPLRRE
jgi:hypothetical protein